MGNKPSKNKNFDKFDKFDIKTLIDSEPIIDTESFNLIPSYSEFYMRRIQGKDELEKLKKGIIKELISNPQNSLSFDVSLYPDNKYLHQDIYVQDIRDLIDCLNKELKPKGWKIDYYKLLSWCFKFRLERVKI